MRYKLLKEIKGVKWQVGVEREVEKDLEKDLEHSFSKAVMALLEHCGFIEEVTEWDANNLNINDGYFVISSMGEVMSATNHLCDNEIYKFRLKTNNIFKDSASAEARLKEIMES